MTISLEERFEAALNCTDEVKSMRTGAFDQGSVCASRTVRSSSTVCTSALMRRATFSNKDPLRPQEASDAQVRDPEADGGSWQSRATRWFRWRYI